MLKKVKNAKLYYLISLDNTQNISKKFLTHANKSKKN